ncbi:MAG TPA: GspE/PulE family protein [Candidatus Peribacteraceae bacterium]|nr:GspE/PulE family protein [Candidatus Peribacteraceae bacterium]
MPLEDVSIGQILVKQSYLSEEELQNALLEAKENKQSLINVLSGQGLITPSLIQGALAEHYKLEFYDLQTNPPSTEELASLPEAIARKYFVIVVEKKENSVKIATTDPQQENLEEVIRMNLGKEEAVFPEEESTEKKREKKGGEEEKKSEEPKEKKGEEEKPKGKKKEVKEKKKAGGGFFGLGRKKAEAEGFKGKITYVFASKEGIEAMFLRYRKPLATRFQQIVDAEKEVAPEILVEIINDAIQLRASDIHFEPQGDKFAIVRFRVDGVMHEAGRIPKIYYEGVVNLIKIEANMRIDEHFAPQDGAIRHVSPDGSTIDIRVSIVPVVDGEKAVMRLLASYVSSLTLSELGFSKENQEVLEKAARKPFGMLLATGPTGSGKSTTLYALVILRNTPDVNISTIEDPVEYKIAGINHIQTNPEANLTFASGLRALVRQDPNVILVGEIRDGETAEIAVNAALTGHLLFSTLHSNDAATAVPRLIDMGLEPFLLASTLEIVIGQRLLRRICPHCRYSYSIPGQEARSLFPGAGKFFKQGKVTLYKGKGCDACGNTGYRGRIGIHELLIVTQEIEELIIARATSADISLLARKQGMKLMFEDGFEKMEAGITTIEELMRVAAPPEVVFEIYGKHGKKK